MSEGLIEREPELIAAERALVTMPPPSLLPVFRGTQMAEAFAAYRELQKALDAGMPDQLMNIRGRVFRKKGYWRAIATAFNLNVSCVKEEGTDTGWLVVYRAATPSGRFAEGDGACENEEKGDGQDTEHNVRSHAHTRAFNRAVSNLVGFGEVSAEEMRADGSRRQPPARQSAAPESDKPVLAPADWRESEHAIPEDAWLLTEVKPGFGDIAGFLHHHRQEVGAEGLPIWKADQYALARTCCEQGQPVRLEMATSNKSGKLYIKTVKPYAPF